jgi:hypothetical protein
VTHLGRNDYFPFTRDELRRHDPEMARLLAELWQVLPTHSAQR